MHIPQSLYADPISKRMIKVTGWQEYMDMNTEFIWKWKEYQIMKERYETPEMEIVEFEAEDIITTSGDPETPFVPFSGNW